MVQLRGPAWSVAGSTASIAYVSVDVEMADNITHRTFAISASQCILWWYAYKVVSSVRVYRICVLFRPRKLVQVPKRALKSICIFSPIIFILEWMRTKQAPTNFVLVCPVTVCPRQDFNWSLFFGS
jgi:hypothetical protein